MMIGFFGFILFILCLIPIGACVFSIISLWYIFKKAGRKGWEAIVPVYNCIVLVEITGLPMWYVPLLFVPAANIYALVMVYLELARRFKQSTEFGIGLIFLSPIFLGMLAFNKQITYVAPQPFGPIFCGNCGGKVKTDDKFCITCGQETNKPKDICLNCGIKIKKEDKFCTHCGTRI